MVQQPTSCRRPVTPESNPSADVNNGMGTPAICSPGSKNRSGTVNVTSTMPRCSVQMPKLCPAALPGQLAGRAHKQDEAVERPIPALRSVSTM
jgi:hypothetical protein